MITSIDYPPRAGLPEWEAGTNSCHGILQESRPLNTGSRLLVSYLFRPRLRSDRHVQHDRKTWHIATSACPHCFQTVLHR